jgi:hypothetical protein
MTIFISIASYRDIELPKTIKSILSNADKPDEIHFGVVDQDLTNKWADLSKIKNLKHLKIHIRDAKGAGYARKLATELYDGEDYFFQTDSHMRFVKGWDTKLKDMYEWCAKDAGTDKVILSQFPAPYEVLTDGSDYYLKGDEFFWSEPSWTSVVNTYYGAWAGNREVIDDLSVPHKSHTVLGALLFSRGQIANDIPYDERIAFMGEELCYAIRAYTRGYEMYAPNEMVAFHFYKRETRPKVWTDQKSSWYNMEKLSADTQKNVLLGIETGVYGIEDHQRYLDYQKMIGIDFYEFYNEEKPVKSDMSFVSQEIMFDMEPEPLSGACISDHHKECFISSCSCYCHRRAND